MLPPVFPPYLHATKLLKDIQGLELHGVAKPEEKNDRDNMQYPPARLKKHETEHSASPVSLPDTIAQCIHYRNGDKVHPPPAHVGITGITALGPYVRVGAKEMQVENGLA